MSISDWSSDVCSSDLLTLHDLGAISLQPVETLARAVGDDHHAAVAGAEALLVAILGELALGAGVEHRIVFPELRQPDVIDVAVPAGEQNALVLAQEHVDIGRDRPRLRDAGDLPHFDIELARRLAAIVEGSRDPLLPERSAERLVGKKGADPCS